MKGEAPERNVELKTRHSGGAELLDILDKQLAKRRKGAETPTGRYNLRTCTRLGFFEQSQGSCIYGPGLPTYLSFTDVEPVYELDQRQEKVARIGSFLVLREVLQNPRR